MDAPDRAGWQAWGMVIVIVIAYLVIVAWSLKMVRGLIP